MKNWTIKEAVEVINAGTDTEAIKEIAKHFPVAFMHIVKGDLVGLASGMGEKFTLRRLDFAGAGADAGEADAVDADTEVGGEEDLSAMTTKQLMALCDKRGIKVPHYGKSKQFYLDQLQGAGGEGDEVEADADAEAEEEDAYAGKTAMELFKECKKRGIEAAPKKPAKYYIGLLQEADAEEAEANGDDEGWGDDDEDEAPTNKPAKSGKATKGAAKGTKATKGTKKTAAKATAADDDEEWDI